MAQKKTLFIAFMCAALGVASGSAALAGDQMPNPLNASHRDCSQLQDMLTQKAKDLSPDKKKIVRRIEKKAQNYCHSGDYTHGVLLYENVLSKLQKTN